MIDQLPPELRGSLERAVHDHDLGARAEVILGAARPRVLLRPSGKVRDEIGATRFGGAPDLPGGYTWPTYSTLGGRRRDMLFVGQINFAEVPPFADSPLPADGLLSLFVADEFGLNPYPHVLGVHELSRLTRWARPDDDDEYEDDAPADPWHPSLGLELALGVSVPSSRSDWVAALDLSVAEGAAYATLRRQLRGGQLVGWLLGHAGTGSSDPLHGHGADPRGDACNLMTIDFEIASRFASDAAWTNLLIREADLAAHRWNESWCEDAQ